MANRNEHDTVVKRLCADIAEVLSGTAAVVLPFVRCQLLDGFPTCLTTFDVAVFGSPPRWVVTPEGSVVGPADVPRTVINIVEAETLATDTISTPNTLARSGVSEYVAFDPTGRFFRPSFQALLRNDDEMVRLWPAIRGVFFSSRGFCLDVRNGLVVTKCVDARTEEELFVLRYERDVLGASGLESRIAKLEARLIELASRPRTRDDE